ncbi:hypothetical protein pb186bvf_007413 [Paramecium bursaria]
MFKLLMVLALVSSINCSFIKELITYIEQNPEEQHIETHNQYNFDEIDITQPPPCEECQCSANLCCPYQPFFIPAIICVRQCTKVFPIQFCVCSCLSSFGCCI